MLNTFVNMTASTRRFFSSLASKLNCFCMSGEGVVYSHFQVFPVLSVIYSALFGKSTVQVHADFPEYTAYHVAKRTASLVNFRGHSHLLESSPSVSTKRWAAVQGHQICLTWIAVNGTKSPKAKRAFGGIQAHFENLRKMLFWKYHVGIIRYEIGCRKW